MDHEHETTPCHPIGVESIMEKIQHLQVTIEESRRYLLPYVKVLEDEDNALLSSSAPSNDGRDYSDALIAEESLHCLEECYTSVNVLVNQLADSGLINLEQSNTVHLNSEEENVYLLMAANCIGKADFVGQHFVKLAEADSLTNESGPIDDVVGVENKVVQPCMARMAELSLRVAQLQTTIIPSEMSSTYDGNDDEEDITPESIIDAYSHYQRRCLRSRSKPAISSLAELRQLATSQNCFVSDILEEDRRRQQYEIEINNDDGNGQVDETTTARAQPHAQAITVLLGEASSLIQPLAAWRDGLIPSQQGAQDIASLLKQMCEEAMEILDNEAQKLAVTVGAWFRPDQRGITTLEHNGNERQEAADLLSIESSLEEMAFMCQVLSRYSTFSRQTVLRDESNKDSSGSELQNLLTEQSLHYSTFETRLATLQFNQALSLATPQLIELGRPSLKVPSIVEDAHFVCVRAIDRAAGTRSERAVWTVGHWVTEVWGVDPGGGMLGESVKGVYQALTEGVGCIGEPPAEQDNQHNAGQGSPSKPENAFAAALLEAVDDGDDYGGRQDHARTGTNSAPASGGLSSALWGTLGGGSKAHSLQTRIDAEMCCLNGIVASENSCKALSNLFADLVDEQLEGDQDNSDAKKTSMLTFAKEELASHARSYHNLLKQRVRGLVSDLCGADDLFDCDGKLCLQNLRLFVEDEVYNLNASSFRSMEDEERLDAEIIAPIRRSQIFEEIGRDKCDGTVVLQMAEEMSLKSSEIILSVLLKSEIPKEFNDWGALLLSKQVRLLQNTFSGLVLGSGDTEEACNTSSILTQFNRVNQAVSILQLEKPSDWLMFAYKADGGDDTSLTADEIKKVMRLRVDFSEEAIATVCSQISAN
mmetsp:Transcript_2191/g.4784  ORF Transcript_2191/g.4784 Transcript_2191/m.4784 type:complete len:876 (-) Transcript_2191:40-2667(-)